MSQRQCRVLGQAVTDCILRSLELIGLLLPVTASDPGQCPLGGKSEHRDGRKGAVGGVLPQVDEEARELDRRREGADGGREFAPLLHVDDPVNEAG